VGQTTGKAQRGRVQERAARLARARQRRLELDKDREAREARIDAAVADAYQAQDDRHDAVRAIEVAEQRIGEAINRILGEGVALAQAAELTELSVTQVQRLRAVAGDDLPGPAGHGTESLIGSGEHIERLLQIALEHPSPENSHRRVEIQPLPLKRRSRTTRMWLPALARGSAVKVHVPPGLKTFESRVVPTTRLCDHSYRSRAQTPGCPRLPRPSWGHARATSRTRARYSATHRSSLAEIGRGRQHPLSRNVPN
jgi:hypothetical protein